jgi:hypothetical protein
VAPWAGDGCYYPGCRKDANCACEMPTVRASNGSSWVLEYQKSVLFEGARLIPAAAELLLSKCSHNSWMA